MAYEFTDAAIYAPLDPRFELIEEVLLRLEFAYNMFAWPYTEHLPMFEKGSYLDLLRDTEGRLLVTPGNLSASMAACGRMMIGIFRREISLPIFPLPNLRDRIRP